MSERDCVFMVVLDTNNQSRYVCVVLGEIGRSIWVSQVVNVRCGKLSIEKKHETKKIIC